MTRAHVRRGAGLGLYTLAILSVGAAAEFTVCGDASCILVRSSDNPSAAIGPFTYEFDAFIPEDGAYTTLELAQNYATLYYAQHLMWKQLKADGAAQSDCPQDVDGNGTVDMNDLVSVLVHWAQACPAPAP